MNNVAPFIIIFTACIGLIVGIVVTVKAIKEHYKQKTKELPLGRLNFVVEETLEQIKKVKDINKLGYEALEEFAVLVIKKQIETSSLFTKYDKKLITNKAIKGFISKKLKALYDAKVGNKL